MASIGRYQVVRELGHGGMGQVYLAHDPTLERDVALKLLHRNGGGLRDEAKALAALSHPGIVTVFEVGEHDGQDYIAMEYLGGRTLRDVLAEKPGRAVLIAICVKVARAVAAAHRAGILHRDIKPENIVITDDGAVKVVDFGIARRLGSESTPHPRVTAQEVVDALTRTMPVADTIVSPGTHTVFGTPAYIAPEVLRGEESDEKSDVYSLGVVLFECLTGRRPHDGTLVEVIAQVIDGPPPQLDDPRDPLGPLVERMLARSPGKRPSLEKIAAALSAPGAPPRRRTRVWWWIGPAGVAMVGLGVAGWLWRASESEVPAAAPMVRAPVVASIAIAPIEVKIPSYGVEPPQASMFAAILARLVGQVDGAKLTGIPIASDDRAAAQAVQADYVIRGAIREVDRVLHAELEIVKVPSGEHVGSVRVEKPRDEPAPLLAKLAQEIARDVAPDAVLPPPPNRARAQVLYADGKPLLDQGRFTDARPYFEQAVEADPTMFEGWYSLALALWWMDAPDARVVATIDRAVALAPPGTKQALARALAAFIAGDFATSREALEPVEQHVPDRTPERRELDYFLGEANWHDGRHAAGFAHFKHALDFDPHFGAATVHAWQYAVARRDVETARFYIGLGTVNREWAEIAAGHFKEVADTGTGPHRVWAQIVLGRSSPDVDAYIADDSLESRTYRLAFAARAGDRDNARAVFAEIWPQIAGVDLVKQPSLIGPVESLAEVTLCAGMTDETRQLMALFATGTRGHARHPKHRIGALAAALLRDPSLIAKDGLSERNARLAAAATAELEGDRAGAAKILRELVDNPTFGWDYPERAALIRNLRALGRRKDAAAVCADTMRPAVFRAAQIVLQQTCKH